MHIGVCRLTLHVPNSQSLKGRRQVSRSLSDRIKDRFNVAVAEEPDNSLWREFTLVVCCVSGDISHSHEMLSRVVAFVEEARWDVEVVDYHTEIISGV